MIKFKNENFAKPAFLTAWEIVKQTRGLSGRERYMIKKVKKEMEPLQEVFNEAVKDLVEEYGNGETNPNGTPKFSSKDKKAKFEKAFDEIAEIEVEIKRPILEDNDSFKFSELDEEMLEGFVDFPDYDEEDKKAKEKKAKAKKAKKK